MIRQAIGFGFYRDLPVMARSLHRHGRPDRPSIHKITDKKQGPPFDDPVTPLITWLTNFGID